MKMFFGWENIKKVVKDIYDTFSSKKSFLSSKRLERFALVSVGLTIILGTFIFLVSKGTLTATDAIMLAGLLLTAAGYNLTQTEKSKKDSEDKDETVDKG